MFHMALVAVFIGTVGCRNAFFSKLKEAKQTTKNLEIRQDDATDDPSLEYEQWDCNTCILADGYTYCQWPDQFHDDGGCLPNVSDGYHTPCSEEDGEKIVDACPADKLELFHHVFEGYKLHQMCESKEFEDCDKPAAQILCEKCQYMSKECDDSGNMVQCFDGTCIDGSYVCDGEVDCPEYEDVDDDGNSVKFKHNEDEYLCPDWMKEAEEYDEYTNLLNEFTKLLQEYELDILNSFKLILQKLQ